MAGNPALCPWRAASLARRLGSKDRSLPSGHGEDAAAADDDNDSQINHGDTCNKGNKAAAQTRVVAKARYPCNEAETDVKGGRGSFGLPD